MEKKLTTSGNSLALVIDETIARLLGLTKDTIVSLTIDGHRLIVEPRDKAAPKRKVRSVTVGEVRKTLWLLDWQKMKNEHFVALSEGTPREVFEGALGLEKVDPLTVKRLMACLERREANPTEPWSERVAAVLSAHPRPADSVPFTYRFQPSLLRIANERRADSTSPPAGAKPAAD